jgi:hypothetical protein
MRRLILRVAPILAALATVGMTTGPDGGCWWQDPVYSEPGQLSPEAKEQLEREQGRPQETRPPDEQLRPRPGIELPDEGGGGY